MTLYRAYYERSRTHLSLDKDAPIPRPVTPASDGVIVVAIPEVGGLHRSIRTPRGLNTWNRRLQSHERRCDCQTRPCCHQLPPFKQGGNVPPLQLRGTRSTV